MRRQRNAWLAVTEGALVLAMVGGEMGIVAGAVAMTGDVTATVGLTHHSPGVGKPFTDVMTAGSASVQPETATLTLSDPTLIERLAAGVPTLVAALTLLLAAAMLYRTVRRIRSGATFATETVGGVVGAARVAGIGTLAYLLLTGPAQVRLGAAAPDSLPVSAAASIDFSPLLIVVALFTFAEVLRQGAAVSEELEGVV